MQQRGFNMFSAVVAVILIMIGVVMTNTLISTEEKTNRQVYSMLGNYQLADAANIARANALQSFNYNFREQLESYLTYCTSDDCLNDISEKGFSLITLRGQGDDFSFNALKKSFEESILLVQDTSGTGGTTTDKQKFDAVLRYVSEKTIDQFAAQEGTYGRFNVRLSDESYLAKQSMHDVLDSALRKNEQDFLEVVGCDSEKYNDCPLGTFYFNVPLNKLTDDEYESLPRIIVSDVITQEEIKLAILPRTNLKIYIPLRFFKVLHEASDLATAMQESHAEIAGYKLGFCDASCTPNADPTSYIGIGSQWNNSCPSSEIGSDAPLAGSGSIGKISQALRNYLAGGKSPGSIALTNFSAAKICDSAYGAHAFDISDPSTFPGFSIYGDQLPLENGVQVEFPDCPLNKVTVISQGEPKATISGNTLGGINTLYCGRVTEARADIAFKEDNPLYIVRGTFEPGMSDVYKIQVLDASYAPAAKSDAPIGSLLTCASLDKSCKPA